ncbi:ribonuclease H-like domain-containing protein [Mycena floridula]|nr:ribonuclease H-like domain-containing protein [Mycena floridula]
MSTRHFNPNFYPGVDLEARVNPIGTGVRWIHEASGILSVVIFTDGAAPNNGQEGVRAGCGISLYPDHQLSSCRIWPAKLVRRRLPTIVIATDSEYVVRGISEYIFKWQSNGWVTSRGEAVKNQDLWLMLLAAVEEYENRGVKVQFWQIPREMNIEADASARLGATMPQNETEWRSIMYTDF